MSKKVPESLSFFIKTVLVLVIISIAGAAFAVMCDIGGAGTMCVFFNSITFYLIGQPSIFISMLFGLDNSTFSMVIGAHVWILLISALITLIFKGLRSKK